MRGACDGAELGHLTGLLQKIRPAVEAVQKEGDLPRDDLVQKVADANVDNVVGEIRAKSAVLDERIRSGNVGIVGAMYSVQSGKVEFGELTCGG